MTTKIAFFCLLVVSCKGIFSNPFFSSDTDDPVFSSISRSVCASRSKQAFKCGNALVDDGENIKNCPRDILKDNKKRIRSYNYLTICKAQSDQIYYPSKTQELSKIVADSIAREKKIKIVAKMHTANDGLCPDNGAVVISMEHLNKAYYDEKTKIVKVEAGMTYGELASYLHSKKRALDIVFPGFTGISIGGALAVGAHGSSVKNVSTLADIVQSLDVIYEKNGQSIEERISPSSPYFNAWLSNLGSLGVVKHVYLKTMDQYVLESRVRLHKEEDIYTQDGIDKILNDCDFAQMVWLPGLRTIPAVERNVISFCGKKARYDESKKYAGRISFVDYEVSDQLFEMSKAMISHGACDSILSCTFEKQRYQSLVGSDSFSRRPYHDGKNHSLEATGLSWKMMASHLSHQGIDFPQVDYAIGIDLDKLPSFVSRFGKIRDSWDQNSKVRMCIPFSGFFFRFGKTDIKTPLSPMSGDNSSSSLRVVVDFVVYNPMEFNEKEKQEYFKPWNYLSSLIVDEFQGRVHLAKNTPEQILKAKKHYVGGIDILKKARLHYAPKDLFSNEFYRNLTH